MKITPHLKQSIAAGLKADYDLKANQDKSFTQSRHATILGLNPSVHSRIMKGDVEGVLGEAQWIRIGKDLGFDLTGQKWQLAATATYSTMMPYMEHCKNKSVMRVFCDLIGIGKTTAAKQFWRKNANVAYVNCKQYRSCQTLIRAIARSFGFEDRGRFHDVRDNLVNNIMALHQPLIILDDAGYLEDKALLEAIGMWDELEQLCGWFYIGEPAFQKRIENMILKNKLGWEAWLDRGAGRILSVTGDMDNEAQVAMMKRSQANQIIALNYPEAKKAVIDTLCAESKCNLRTLRDDINKLKTAVA